MKGFFVAKYLICNNISHEYFLQNIPWKVLHLELDHSCLRHRRRGHRQTPTTVLLHIATSAMLFDTFVISSATFIVSSIDNFVDSSIATKSFSASGVVSYTLAARRLLQRHSSVT
jgi:cytochrome c biogenesis factor